MESLKLKGTLEEKFEKVKKIHKEIKYIQNEGIRESIKLNLLKEKRCQLERSIQDYLLNGEQLENHLEDYCFRNFAQSSYQDDLNNEIIYSPSVFERIPKVKEFTHEIEKVNGQKILMIQENDLKTGIISGPCEFEIEVQFRYLFVPVEKLFEFDFQKKEWYQNKLKIKDKNLIFINPDIFKYPSQQRLHFMGENWRIWKTDYSKVKYISGGPPEETTIYLGNDYVESVLENLEVTIPSKKIKVTLPEYKKAR